MNCDWNEEFEKDGEVTDDGYDVPSLYGVWLHNDDFTPMDFVVGVLERLFFMDRRQAVSVMMEAHQTGRVMCGVFGKDVAETKVLQLKEFAALHEHPLSCRMDAA